MFTSDIKLVANFMWTLSIKLLTLFFLHLFTMFMEEYFSVFHCLKWRDQESQFGGMFRNMFVRHLCLSQKTMEMSVCCDCDCKVHYSGMAVSVTVTASEGCW